MSAVVGAGTPTWPSAASAARNGLTALTVTTCESDLPSLPKTEKARGLIKILRLSREKSKRCKKAPGPGGAAPGWHTMPFFAAFLRGFRALAVVKENRSRVIDVLR